MINEETQEPLLRGLPDVYPGCGVFRLYPSDLGNYTLSVPYTLVFQMSDKVYPGECVKMYYQHTAEIVPQVLPKVLRVEEIQRITALCDPVEYVIFEFYVRTGVRAMEGLRLKVKDVNLNEDFIFIQRGKRIKDRVVPFDTRLKEILQEYIKKYDLKPEDPLFCVQKIGGSSITNTRYYKKTPHAYSDTSLTNKINDLAIRAGVQETIPPGTPGGHPKLTTRRVHPHLLRHTALTMIQESCGDAFITKEIAGHTNVNTTSIYVHLAIKRKREAVEKAFTEIDTPPMGEGRSPTQAVTRRWG